MFYRSVSDEGVKHSSFELHNIMLIKASVRTVWHEMSFTDFLLTAESSFQVHRILVDLVSAAANGTAGLGRYPPLKREVLINLMLCSCNYVICTKILKFGEYIRRTCFYLTSLG